MFSAESVIKDVMTVNPSVAMIIESIAPIGLTANLKQELGCDNIIFSPKFLREGKALFDNLHPPRIIVG